MIAEKIPALGKLSLEEKFILAGELWDEVVAHPDALPVREDHLKLLWERLEQFSQHPEDTVPWDIVKARFAQQTEPRIRDYTAERYQWLRENESLEKIAEEANRIAAEFGVGTKVD